MANIKPFDAQVQFQSSAQGGRFDPYQVPDPNGGLSGQLNAINQSFQNAEQGGVRNLRETSKNIEELSKFSETLSQGLMQGTQLYGKFQEEQAALMFAQDAAAQEAALTAYEPQEKVLMATDRLHTQQASLAIRQGAPVEVVERLKSLSGLKGFYYKRNAAKHYASQFKDWASRQFLENGEIINVNGIEKPINSPDWAPEHKAAIMQRLLGEYMTQNGMTSMSQGLLAKYALPDINKAQSELMASFREQYGLSQSRIQRDELLANFNTDNDFTKLLSGLATTYDEKGPLGYGRAWKSAVDVVLAGFETGNMTEDRLEGIENQIDPETGKRLADRWPATFKDLRHKLAAANRAKFKEGQEEDMIRAKQYEQEMLDYFSQNPQEATDEALREVKRKFFELSGGESSSALNTIESTYSVSAQAKERLNTQFEKLAEQGLLSPEMVKRAPWDVQQKWAKVAADQASATDQSAAFKTQIKAIENQVKSNPAVKVSPDGSTSGLATLVIGELQAKFRRKVAEYVGAGMSPQAAANQAVAEVFKEFEVNPRYHLNDRGEFSNFMPKNTVGNSKALNAKLNNIRTKLRYGGKASLDVTPGLMFDKAELLAMEKGYGQPGWSVPPVASYWASQLNMNPLEIINRQRTAAGLKPLSTPASIERVQRTISPALQGILNRYQSPNRSTRALSSTGQYDPALVKGGYGAVVQRAAQQHGIDPSILAGLIETESGWNPNAVSKAGARGIAQIMPQYHPGVNVNDPVASINYAAKYLSQLQRQFGGDMRLALIAYNAGPGNVEKYRGPIPGDTESSSYYGKVLKSAAKYGYGKAWSDQATMRGKFRVTEYLTGDPNHGGFRADHGGDNYHEHIAFATKAQRDAAIKKLTAAGIQIGSVDRPGDPGNHGKGLAIDIPASQVPVGKEKELSRRVRSILGIS